MNAAPSIIHGPSDKGQCEFMKEQCDKLVKSHNRVKAGKGSNPRPIKKAIFDANWNLIRWS
jgi:hypothetical protein